MYNSSNNEQDNNNNNNNGQLTEDQSDVLRFLSTDNDPIMDDSTNIDTQALMMNMFPLLDHPLAVPPTTIQSQQQQQQQQPSQPPDFYNFDLSEQTQQQQQQYTPPPDDTFYSQQAFISPSRFNQRRHSVAVGVEFFNNNQSFHSAQSIPFAVDHRGSLPDIYQQDRFGSSSVTHPPQHHPTIQFEQLPWSRNESSVTNHRKMNEPVRHRRFLSQQFDIPPTIGPPMSDVPSRRLSVASPNDISVWNKMVSNNNLTSNTMNDIIEETKVNDSDDQTNNNPSTAAEDEDGKQDAKRKRPRREPQSGTTDGIKLENNDDQKYPEDYPIITEADMQAAEKDANAIPRRQKLRYEGDEYTPKWVRYTGQSKEGYCDTCQPGKWLQLKNSAYWYHKQFFHGISSVSGKPFQQPLEQRPGEHDILEGLCHQCKEYVPICNSKRKNSVLWYRHAHKCHIYDRPKPRIGSSVSIATTSGSSNGTASRRNSISVQQQCSQPHLQPQSLQPPLQPQSEAQPQSKKKKALVNE
ncbi:hypothetical protein CU097_007048 [Rhizopus azygosporus]|uniref:Transcription regulator Rua1 C-terminal domain-containing protein n=1 Tax=Rhizopus azygosporus TaxID=86630 RepID=A0A367J395_RHIAZ|nr:hypothetical protein CU097_007048 [Rhizopus azygosporus]